MKTKKSLIIKLSFSVMILCAFLLLTTACGKQLPVTITDGNIVTQTQAKSNMTVKEIIEKAEITLGEKDKTEPSLDSKLDGAQEITVKRYAKVTVVCDKKKKTVELYGAKVKDAVKAAGYDIDKEFSVDADEDAYLTDAMTLTVKKSITVSITADGKTTKHQTFKTSVSELLKELNLKLGKYDTISVDPDYEIKNGVSIVITRVEYKTETRTESVPFKTKRQNSASLEKGKTKIIKNGVNGERKATYKVKYVDGVKTEQVLQSQEITKNPVTQIISVGTANPKPAGKTIVSKQPVYDCDGSGHGYYVITYSDGSVDYKAF